MGAARAPSAAPAHAAAPQTPPCCTQQLDPAPSSSYIHTSMYSYFSFPRRKGLLGSDPSNAPFQHPKGGERQEAGGAAGGGRGELPSVAAENVVRKKDWEKNNSNKHFMKQKMAYKEVNF